MKFFNNKKRLNSDLKNKRIFDQMDQKMITEEIENLKLEQEFNEVKKVLKNNSNFQLETIDDLIDLKKMKIQILESEIKLGKSTYSEKIIAYKHDVLKKEQEEFSKLLDLKLKKIKKQDEEKLNANLKQDESSKIKRNVNVEAENKAKLEEINNISEVSEKKSFTVKKQTAKQKKATTPKHAEPKKQNLESEKVILEEKTVEAPTENLTDSKHL